MAVTSRPTPPPSEAAEGPARRGALGGAAGLGRRFLTLREGSITVVTLITFVYFATNVGRFATGNNFTNLLPYFAPYAIMAAGEVFVMINGEIDLSIGAMYLFVPFLFHEVHHAGLPIYPALIASLAVAAALGVCNAVAVSVLNISSFVATLGMLFVLDGVTLIMSHAAPVNTPGTAVIGLNTFAQVFGAGTYSELIWAVAIVGLLQLVLTFTRWGLYTIAVGGNRIGAAEAGISVRRVMMRNFAASAVLAGFTGILEAVRVTTATPDPSASNDILFQAISAAVIGGTLLRGGSGTVVGALIGALFLGILHDGLILKGVSANYLDLYLGIAILIAMAINTYVSRVRVGSGRA
ncbi:MAG TPA: ABC transporter permease [Solirubrobacteraceae bacterium]|nr:ABC transporter permease [Solirubrobacteraceae bacterium]